MTSQTSPVAGTLEQLVRRREEETIKPRQFDMVVRELLRTVSDTHKNEPPVVAEEPEPEIVEVDGQGLPSGADVKYPDVNVPLYCENGNALSVIGRVRSALRRAGVDADEIEQFSNEATSGDYDNLLATAMKWVDTNNYDI